MPWWYSGTKTSSGGTCMVRRVASRVIVAGVIAVLGALIYLAEWHAGASALHHSAQGDAAQPAAVTATPVQNLPMQPEMIPFPAPANCRTPSTDAAHAGSTDNPSRAS